MLDKFNCISCNSTNVIKHGKTATGSPRLRCHDCGKTFSIKEDDLPRLEIWKVADFYLSGKSYRDLVKLYQSSPRRLNQKIRVAEDEVLRLIKLTRAIAQKLYDGYNRIS